MSIVSSSEGAKAGDALPSVSSRVTVDAIDVSTGSKDEILTIEAGLMLVLNGAAEVGMEGAEDAITGWRETSRV